MKPYNFRSVPVRRHQRSKAKILIPLVIFFGIVVWYGLKYKIQHDNPPPDVDTLKSATLAESIKVPGPVKQFTSKEFQSLYEAFAYPNTQEVQRPIRITGNVSADARIEELAVQRGYRLRMIPVVAIPKIEDYWLQQKAVQPWSDMKAAAATDGIRISIYSGFRSPEDQRDVFLERLYASGVTANEIASGQADATVLEVLRTTALPGYSRHHTGYTIDIRCENNRAQSFEYTVCFNWLSKDNYKNAKTYGWIPSYPDGAKSQGPDPESWEYVWVGREAVSE